MKINHSFLKYKEGRILLLGLILLGSYLMLLLFSALFFPDYLQLILSITATNIIFGRMVGLSIGIASQMNTTLLIAFNIFIESIMVLTLYPLFVLSWNKLDFISYPPLNQYLERTKKKAHKYEPIIKRYGAIGLILFVFTPFVMTGPVVASFVGFLIGFRHRKTLIIVLSSTLVAIIIWLYVIKNFEELLITYNDMLMIGLLIAAIVLFLWYLFKKALRRKKLP